MPDSDGYEPRPRAAKFVPVNGPDGQVAGRRYGDAPIEWDNGINPWVDPVTDSSAFKAGMSVLGILMLASLVRPKKRRKKRGKKKLE